VKRVTRITGRCLVLPVDDIDTDQIIPGRFLKTTSRSGLGRLVFHDWRFDDHGQPRRDWPGTARVDGGASVLVAGANFGCGSSREHAAWALVDAGFEAVVARSFADIFRQNALGNGLLPIALAPAAHRDLLAALAARPDTEMVIDLERLQIQWTGGPAVSFSIEAFARRCLLEGVDHLDLVRRQEPAIAEYERLHPAPFDTRTTAE
jgi:3-isopropylmalate/(R)-2-methylmalate dehydratase small subunit